eukprot:scaffold25026_cov142-Cylindrotheca_fusiformis.AAC.1
MSSVLLIGLRVVALQEVLFITFAAVFVLLYNDILVSGFDDFNGVHHDGLATFLPPLKLPLVPFTLSSGALGLLLTFRTNVSYSRWNEARTAWGKVINDSRSIARMGCIWSKSYKNIDDAAVQRLGEAICSFSRSLMNRTLPPQEDEENFKKYTYERISDQNYAEILRNAKHRPTAALAELTSTLVDYKLNPLHQVEVEHVVTGLCDALGASERIFTSPVPTFYTRHTARFLAFWLLALPLGLFEPMSATWNHIGVLPVVVLISGFLLGIEELATQMEEPFSILPMEKMCEGSIRTSVMEQVERSQMGIQSPYYGEGKRVNSYATGEAVSVPAPAPASAHVVEAATTSNHSEPKTHGLGAGGMADTRDPEAYADADPRKSISAAPTFEEYMKLRESQK